MSYAPIKYTSVINSFVSTEGSGGIMTNYIYYSILVVHTDGTCEIVEGKQGQVSFLLPYLRTPMDEIAELRETVKGLREDINEILEDKTRYIIDSLYPIPAVLGMNEVEALEALRASGLTPELEIEYPASTPPTGVIRSVVRSDENFRRIRVNVFHAVPAVEGMPLDRALAALKEAGFDADVAYRSVYEGENRLVLSCLREAEDAMHVSLTVSHKLPAVEGLPLDRALAALKEAGFDADVSFRCVFEEENGLVLHCLGEAEDAAHVTLTVSKKLPEFTGLSAENACKILEQEGVAVSLKVRPSEARPGTVFNWAIVGDQAVELMVSAPETVKAHQVDVEWTTMMDSLEDSYSATAEFNHKTQTLSIQLAYVSGAKSKHQITSVGSQFALGNAPKVNPACIEPGTRGSLTITVPCATPLEQLPPKMQLTLYTTFGLVKKNDSISLQFTFDW